MKTSLTQIALLSAAIGLFSSGALAHQDNPEAGPYHYFQHLQEARSQAQTAQDQTGKDAGMAGMSAEQTRGPAGPVRSELGGDDWNEAQRDLDRRLGGVGGFDTN